MEERGLALGLTLLHQQCMLESVHLATLWGTLLPTVYL